MTVIPTTTSQKDSSLLFFHSFRYFHESQTEEKGKKEKESIIRVKESIGHEGKAQNMKESIETEVLPIENGELLLSSESYGLQLHLCEAAEENI